MTRTYATANEAFEAAHELRSIHRGTEWTVSIEKPLFVGDVWRVIVG